MYGYNDYQLHTSQKKFLFEQKVDVDAKSIALSARQNLIALASIGKVAIYNYSNLKTGHNKDSELKLTMRSKNATFIDWNNEVEYLIATACNNNCTIYEANYGQAMASIEMTNSFKWIAWSK